MYGCVFTYIYIYIYIDIYIYIYIYIYTHTHINNNYINTDSWNLANWYSTCGIVQILLSTVSVCVVIDHELMKQDVEK